MCEWVCVRARVCVCVFAHVRACVRVCVCICVNILICIYRRLALFRPNSPSFFNYIKHSRSSSRLSLLSYRCLHWLEEVEKQVGGSVAQLALIVAPVVLTLLLDILLHLRLAYRCYVTSTSLSSFLSLSPSLSSL